MADLLNRDFKATALRMLKKMKGRCGGGQRAMCEQNGMIDKEIENMKPKRNSGAGKYNN